MAIKDRLVNLFRGTLLPSLCEPSPPSFLLILGHHLLPISPFFDLSPYHFLLSLDCHQHHLSRLPFLFFKQPAPPTSSPSPSYISDQ